MHIIEEAFGKKCNLYTDVLGCTDQSDNATLRKAYYRTALKYHPDKNPEQPQEAAKKFHAITAAYQILCNTELRKEYDETGIIPRSIDDDDDDGDDGAFNGDNPWKDYFDRIFGKVSVSHIEAFAIKYKCSSEEQRDVLQQYVQQKGNLIKMINHVMLSEFCDASRWVEDYIQPAIDAGSVPSQYNDMMQKTLQQCKKKAEKEYKEKLKESKSAANEMHHDDDEEEDDEDDDDDDDDDENDKDNDDDETEEEDEEIAPSKNAKSAAGKQSLKKSSMSPKKAQPTVTKRKTSTAKHTKNVPKSNKNKNDMSDLVAMIRNKNKSSNNSNNTWSTFGARYGVSINDDDDDDDDPIKDDTVFAKVQSKLKNNHQRNKKSK